MTGFFDLPAELRLYTYEIALADAIKAPMYFHFNDVLKLHDFKEWTSTQSGLEALRFSLRLPLFNRYRDCSYDLQLTTQAVQLLHTGAATDRFDLRILLQDFFPVLEAGILAELAVRNASLRSRPQSISVRKGIPLPGPDSNGMISYLAVELSTSSSAVQLSRYQKEPSVSDRNFPTNYHLYPVMDMKGLVKDLTFEGLDIDLLRAKLYHARDAPWKNRHGFVRGSRSEKMWELYAELGKRERSNVIAGILEFPESDDSELETDSEDFSDGSVDLD
ncbi:hypothetical protein LTR37_016367 [Vermiconidia calcicola]|uniref:Uncharacterized protein n=1 Tax=Vermiconidia calcicola TaxID=1690605 RepID=A0ACC3MQU4_9PEZI|nr:hypothetical protein LTR37_016367 [Vermiconidia calcicola]